MAQSMLDTLSSASLARTAITANWEDYHYCLGRSANAELQMGPYLNWFMTSLPDPFMNLVVCRGLPPDGAEDLVGGAMAYLRSRHIRKFSWLTHEDVPCDRLNEMLLDHGLTIKKSFATEMAVDLSVLPEVVPAIPGLDIIRVTGGEALKDWIHVASANFGIDPEFERQWCAICEDRSADPQLRTFLALLDGRAVGTSQLFLSEGVAGIYNVTCLPEARGRGIGSAVTLTALLEAQAMGCAIGVLQASKRGYPVYRRLGFQDFGDLSLFLWEEHAQQKGD